MADDQGTPGGDEGLRALEELASKPAAGRGGIPLAGLVAIGIALVVGAAAFWVSRDRGAAQALGLGPAPEVTVLELLNRRTAELEALVNKSKAQASALSARGQLGHEVCATREGLEEYRAAVVAYRDAVQLNRASIEAAAAEVEGARKAAMVDPASMERQGGVLYRMLLAPEFLQVSIEEEQGVAELAGLTDLLLRHWGRWSWPRTSAGPEFHGDDAELVRTEFVQRTKRMVDAFQRQGAAQAALQKRIAEWRTGNSGTGR